MEHSFDVEVATKYGVNAAVLYWYFSKMYEADRLHKENFHMNVCYSTFRNEALKNMFKYMSFQEIRKGIKTLEEATLITTIKGKDYYMVHVV